MNATIVEGERWWYVCHVYRTEPEAKSAFVRMNTHAARLEGMAQIAGYRVLDAAGDAVIVIVVGQIEERVREAEEILNGWPLEVEHKIVVALIRRRIKYIKAGEELGAPPGVYHHNYGEQGLALNDDGDPQPQ